jgi:hypothetical protein
MTFAYLRQIDNNLFHRNYRIMILIKGGDAAVDRRSFQNLLHYLIGSEPKNRSVEIDEKKKHDAESVEIQNRTKKATFPPAVCCAVGSYSNGVIISFIPQIHIDIGIQPTAAMFIVVFNLYRILTFLSRVSECPRNKIVICVFLQTSDNAIVSSAGPDWSLIIIILVRHATIDSISDNIGFTALIPSKLNLGGHDI